jgi:ParB family chromosome partitioning protein
MEAKTTKDSGPRKALGRGLAALIPPSSGAAPAMASSPGLRLLPIERIRPNKSQPRKTFAEDALAELAASIEEQGVLQPVLVRRRGEDYELIAGEWRWRAAAKAGLREIPAVIKELSDAEALAVALIENLQRQDLDPLEEAEAYSRLIREHHLTQDEVATAVGKSRVAITNSLRLLKLPDAILAMLGDGRLTAGHARALMTVTSEAAQLKLASDVAARKLSVRDTERLARLAQAPAAKKSTPGRRTPAEAQVEERLQRALGTKVRLKNRRGKGRIEVYFHSLDELDRLLDKLT